MDRDHVALGEEEVAEDASHRTGDHDRGLVGHDLDEVLFLGDGVTGLDVPLDDLAFGDAFANVREQELHVASRLPSWAARERAFGFAEAESGLGE